MSLFSLVQAVEQRADEMIQNPKIQIAAGTVLTATPMWVASLQTWLGLIATAFGAIIGAHGVYRIFAPIVRGWFNKS